MSRTVKCSVEIHNVTGVPDAYIVARCSNGQLWYWGTWENENEALSVAEKLGNAVVVKAEI